ncbi:MAG: hydrogenase [Planctomycetia bacterium]|nr:hydrogenase [Planctomycetia bacterium]
MANLLILFPLAMAALALGVPSNRWRPWLLPAGCAVQVGLSLWAMGAVECSALGGWLALDPLGRVFLGFTSVFFFLCSLYIPGYLAHSAGQSNRWLCANLFVFLAMMTLVILSHHLGLMWVAMEATTLATAPLLYFHRTSRALEATWKYLVICSVGIALALLGSFFLAYSALHGGLKTTLLFDELVRHAEQLSPTWLRAGFVLLLVGYGTKMGLAPMHTWLPDAHGEAPAPVSALLSGALLPSAFLAILRVFHICQASRHGAFAQEILLVMGLLSMAFAAVFVVRQRDFKRLLAYSSVEHMGILIAGIGLGGQAVYGALLHVLTHGFTKGMLFLSAGNIHQVYGSKSTDVVRGVMRRLPLSGAMFLVGFLAITGSPPFGPFVSEVTIASAALSRGHYLAGGLFLFLLCAVFIGMGTTVLAVVQGSPEDSAVESLKSNGRGDRFATGAPIVLLLAIVLLLGVYIPPPLNALLHKAADFLQVTP